MNRTWHLYDLATGLFIGRSFSAHDEESLKANTPEGHGGHEATHIDHLSQRLDLMTDDIVDYQPPAPSANHEWDEVTKRWRLNTAAVARKAAQASATAQIAALEAKQARALRELALGYDGARGRLDALDKQIIDLRVALSTGG